MVIVLDHFHWYVEPDPDSSVIGSASELLNTFTAAAHGFRDEQLITFTGARLPRGIEAGRSYYVRASTADSFQVSLVSGGEALDLMSDGQFTARSSAAYWAPPDETLVLGTLDLRPLEAQARAGGRPDGWGLFVYPQPTGGIDPLVLGESLDETLDTRTRDEIKRRFALATLDAATTHDLVIELLGVQADPTGVDRAKPIMPAHGRWGYRIAAQKRLVPWSPSDALWDRVRGVLRNDYGAMLAVRDVGKMPQETIERWLGWCKDKYRVDVTEITAGREPLEPRAPSTTVADTFDRANNTNLNASDSGKTTNGSPATWQWTEVSGDSQIVSQHIEGGSGQVLARCEQDLSSSDNYGQVDVINIGGSTTRGVGAATRYASAANTCYLCRLFGGSATKLFRPAKLIAGTVTNLSAGTGQTTSFPDTIRVSVTGSSVSLLFNGVTTETVTDTSISGGTRAGFYFLDATVSYQLDNFEGADVAAGGTFTATAALTIRGATTAAQASHTPPVFTGAAALTIRGATTAAQASHTPPVFTGAAALKIGSVTASAQSGESAISYSTVASEVFIGGSVAGTCFLAGSERNEIFLAGAEAGQVQR